MSTKSNKNFKKNGNKEFIFYTRPTFRPLHKRKDKYSKLMVKTDKLIQLFKKYR